MMKMSALILHSSPFALLVKAGSLTRLLLSNLSIFHQMHSHSAHRRFVYPSLTDVNELFAESNVLLSTTNYHQRCLSNSA